MDVFSRWAGETTNEIDMHLHHFNMLDTSIENKKPTTIACHIVKMKKKYCMDVLPKSFSI